MAEEKEEQKEQQQAEQQAQQEQEEVEVPAKFKKIVEEIEQMKVADLAELVKILEKGGAEEKSEYDIVLTKVGDKKIEVIKVVRDVTQKGLKESKDLVDAAENQPQVVKEKVKKEEAEEIKKKFEVAGAQVELK